MGAGASLFGPTSLPSGTELLESAIRLFVSSSKLQDLLDELLRHESFPRLVPEALLQRFGDIRSADIPEGFYAPFRDALPNGLHGWVAAAEQSGCTVLTTNFDLCLERVGVSALHLHGRADDPATLIHTIVRVGKGIEKPVATAATAMAKERPLTVIGYSGNDDDVLALLTEVGALRIDWLVRDNEDYARPNYTRRAKSLPPTHFFNLDLKIEEDRLPRPDRVWEPAAVTAASIAVLPSELAQLEMVLAVGLQLQDYRLAERILLAEPDLAGTDTDRCSLLVLGCYVERQRAHYDKALAFATKAEALTPAFDLLRARLATEKGLVHLDQNVPALDLAEEELVRAYRLSRAHPEEEPYERFSASAVHNLGWLAEKQGRLRLALRRYRAALAMKHRLGDLTHELLSARDVSIMMLVLHKQGTASYLERFWYLNAKFGSEYETADFYFLLGKAHLRSGDIEEARRQLDWAQWLFADMEEWDRVEQISVILNSPANDQSFMSAP